VLAMTALPWPLALAKPASVEHEDGADDFAGFHGAEGFVDVIQAAAARDHLIETQAALHVEIDVARHVDAEAVGAHHAALEFAAEEHAPIQLQHLADGHQTDHRRRAFDADRLEALGHGLLQANRLERVVDAAAGHLANRLHRVARRSIDDVRG